jgi:hypothetical protein
VSLSTILFGKITVMYCKNGGCAGIFLNKFSKIVNVCQYQIMNFNIEQRISIIKWYCPAKEGRSGRTAAVRVEDRLQLSFNYIF